MRIKWSPTPFGALTMELWPRKVWGLLWDSQVFEARDSLAAKAWNNVVGGLPNQNVYLGSSLVLKPWGGGGACQIPQCT
jgi:hypothetical protein